MKTDVEVTVTGDLPFNEKAISGINISYGINAIPVCILNLDAPYIEKTSPEFLCKPEIYKSRNLNVSISVKSKTGCIKFDGYFDGLNISQSVGSISYQAVIKNKFQRLLEIYPRAIGIMPSSYSIFRTVDNVKIEHGDLRKNIAEFTVGTNKLDVSKSIGEFLMGYIKAIVRTQFDFQLNFNTTENYNGLLSQIRSKVYLENLTESNKLFDKVDLSYVAKCAILSNEIGNYIAEQTLGEHTDLWDLMLRAYDVLGCVLLVGNDTLTVVPAATYLKIDHAVPPHQGTSSKPNTANPADYNGFSVSNNGFVNIKYCYVVVDAVNLGPYSARLPNEVTQHMGIYPKTDDKEIPDDGSSGILIVKASPFLIPAINAGWTMNDEMQQKLQSRSSHFDRPAVDPDVPKEDMEKANKVWFESMHSSVLLDQYAKLKFLQMKYADRTGSFTSVFNPNWVPATTGSLYTRTPGLFVNFYVNEVRHTITMDVPNQGSAVTSVNFSSVRMGRQGEIPGVEEDELFQYSKSDMEGLQKKWIKDISGV